MPYIKKEYDNEYETMNRLKKSIFNFSTILNGSIGVDTTSNVGWRYMSTISTDFSPIMVEKEEEEDIYVFSAFTWSTIKREDTCWNKCEEDPVYSVI